MSLQAAACTHRIAFGPRAGQKVLSLQGVMPRDERQAEPLCANAQGFSLHAAVRCGAETLANGSSSCADTSRARLSPTNGCN